MGHAKRKLEEAEARLFWSTGEYICRDHVIEPWLRNQVIRAAAAEVCVVCGTEAVDAADLDSLLDFIAGAIRCHWGRAIDDLFFDRESPSGFALIEDPPTTEDLVRNEMYEDVDEGLLDLIAPLMVEEQWYDRGRLWLEGTELLQFSWEAFSEWARTTTGSLEHHHGPTTPWTHNEAADGIPPDQMLGRLLEMVDAYALVRTDGRDWYRMVSVTPGEPITAARVGTVPLHLCTRPNRMSPAGVPMFYGAADPATAEQEVGLPPPGCVSYLGRWAPSRPLSLLDLTQEPDLPSFYDVERVRQRQALQFLRSFAAAISEPVDSVDGLTAYRPTQALTEFMRRNIDALDGVLYRSSKTGGTCCTLFIANAACVDGAARVPRGPALILQ